MRDYLTLVTSQATGQPYDRVIRELSRNKWMDPKQAIEYGMIDKVGGGRAWVCLGSATKQADKCLLRHGWTR